MYLTLPLSWTLSEIILVSMATYLLKGIRLEFPEDSGNCYSGVRKKPDCAEGL